MNIKDIAIGAKLYYIGNYPGMQSVYGQRGTISAVAEDRNQVMLDLNISDGLYLTTFHLNPMDVSPDKPGTADELREEIRRLTAEKIDQQNEILVLKGQAQERSRQLEMARSLADEHADTIKRKDDRILQANNQILRHETSIEELRKELQRVQDKHDYYQQRTMEKIHEIENLERGLTAANAALEAAQKFNDSLAQEVVHLRSMSSNTEDSVSKTISEKDSIITSLRSQIESLQSISISQKMMLIGEKPHELECRLKKVEEFLTNQFESFK